MRRCVHSSCLNPCQAINRPTFFFSSSQTMNHLLLSWLDAMPQDTSHLKTTATAEDEDMFEDYNEAAEEEAKGEEDGGPSFPKCVFVGMGSTGSGGVGNEAAFVPPVHLSKRRSPIQALSPLLLTIFSKTCSPTSETGRRLAHHNAKLSLHLQTSKNNRQETLVHQLYSLLFRLSDTPQQKNTRKCLAQ